MPISYQDPSIGGEHPYPRHAAAEGDLPHGRLYGLCVGGSCCDLCDPCNMSSAAVRVSGPAFHCMSAYCVDVAKLTEHAAGLRVGYEKTASVR